MALLPHGAHQLGYGNENFSDLPYNLRVKVVVNGAKYSQNAIKYRSFVLLVQERVKSM